MQNLPSAETYEKEYTFFPWGILVAEILEIIKKDAPENGQVLDLMCGTGYMMDKIKTSRPDLNLTGVDLNSEFIDYAEKQYLHSDFILADASTWQSDKKYDVVLCAAGLHHLEYEKHESFIQNIADMLNGNGIAIIADPYVDNYANEQERKIASAKLGYEYLAQTIRNGAPDDVVKAAVSIMENDVMMVEYKNSIQKIKPIMEKTFSEVALKKTWPEAESEYGDYYFLLKR